MEHSGHREFSATRRRAVPSILAIGPDRPCLNALAQRLGHLGYLVVLAETGRSGLDLIGARGFALVLASARLPDMSGLHILAEIRGSRDIADLPVVMLLDPEATSADAAPLIDAGADDVFAQPYAFDLLTARLNRVLARAARLEELKRANLALDARIAARAIELGEVRSELARLRAEQLRQCPLAPGQQAAALHA